MFSTRTLPNKSAPRAPLFWTLAALPLAAAVLLALPARPAVAQTKALEKIAAPAPTRAAMSKPEARKRIETYLASIDTPIPEQAWRDLGPNGALVLEEIARDAKELPTTRARALSAWSIVDPASAKAPQTMMTLAKNETEPPIVRTAALRAAGEILPPARLVPSLEPLLTKAKNPRVRVAAAEVLTAHNPSAACSAVRQQLSRESNLHRAAFDEALKPCSSRPGAKPVDPTLK
jgi:HEAT repeat protein